MSIQAVFSFFPRFRIALLIPILVHLGIAHSCSMCHPSDTITFSSSFMIWLFLVWSCLCASSLQSFSPSVLSCLLGPFSGLLYCDSLGTLPIRWVKRYIISESNCHSASSYMCSVFVLRPLHGFYNTVFSANRPWDVVSLQLLRVVYARSTSTTWVNTQWILCR